MIDKNSTKRTTFGGTPYKIVSHLKDVEGKSIKAFTSYGVSYTFNYASICPQTIEKCVVVEEVNKFVVPYEDNTVVGNQHPGVIEKVNWVGEMDGAAKNQMFVGKISSVEHPESLNTGCNEHWAINNCQDGSNVKGNEVVVLIDDSNTETVAINEIGGIQEVTSVDSSMQTALPIEDSAKSSHSSSLYSDGQDSLLLSTNAYGRTNFVDEILNYIPTRQFISRGSQTDLHFDGCIHDGLKMELQREGLWKLVNYFGDRMCSSQENFMGVTDCGVIRNIPWTGRQWIPSLSDFIKRQIRMLPKFQYAIPRSDAPLYQPNLTCPGNTTPKSELKAFVYKDSTTFQ